MIRKRFISIGAARPRKQNATSLLAMAVAERADIEHNRKRSIQRWVLAVLIVQLGPVALARRADAQRFPPDERIHIPTATPDLVVALTVPTQIQQTGQALVEIRVDNTLTPVLSTPFGNIMGGSAVTGVVLLVRFVGLEPLAVQGTNGLQCGLGGAGGTAPPTYVMCTGGAIPAGGNATISVSVKERTLSCVTYCAPAYTDALVDQSNAIAERLETNNRALGATDVIACIN